MAQSIDICCEQLPKARLREGVAGEEDVASMEGDAGGVEEVTTTEDKIDSLLIFSLLYICKGSCLSLCSYIFGWWGEICLRCNYSIF